MGRKGTNKDVDVETVDVRGVKPDVKTDSAFEIWMAKQKGYGRKLKKGQAVVELAKIGLKTEGIIL